ncbi:DUF6683 family protein [Rubrivirga sp.]|uniref:DUF6683 family protein n=1 Tax=Rubrivirga sp. TaxID=1885344 RepID=UPI003C764752
MFRLFTAIVVVLITPAANAQFGGADIPDLSDVARALAGTQEAPTSGTSGVVRSGLVVPRVEPGETARGIARMLRESAEQNSGPQPVLAQFEAQMPAILANLETTLESVGLAPRDFGVAAGYALIYFWEAAEAEVIPEAASLAAARTVATATGEAWSDTFAAMTDAEQERAYETLLIVPTMLHTFAPLFEQNDEPARGAEMRATARSLFAALFGTDPASVRVDARGRISGLSSGAMATPDGLSPTEENAAAASPAAPRISGGALPSASANGADIYIKYTWGYGLNGMINSQEPLILFPDGTAVTDMPAGGVTEFTPGAIRAGLDSDDRREHVGTWERSGSRLTLRVDGETRVLRRTPRGWWDDEDPIDNESGYDTYFPVVEAGTRHILGPWETSTVLVTGMNSPNIPTVGFGESTDRVFYADGTYSELSERAVTGDFGGVGAYQTNRGSAAGRWRLDGPLLTIEQDGRRGIVLGFIMPNWSLDNPNDDMWVGRDYWERPD